MERDLKMTLELPSYFAIDFTPGAGSKAHELKTWACYFESVWTGAKTFEVRKDDRGFEVGHILLLREVRCVYYNGDMSQARIVHDKDGGPSYTGRVVVAMVTYALKGSPLVASETAVLSILVLWKGEYSRVFKIVDMEVPFA